MHGPTDLERLRAALAGRYAVDRELGHGGMAVVFLARDAKHHRPVAIKVLRPELALALGPERFLREIEIAAGLTHPHILPLYDSGEADGLLYYITPFIEGEALRDRLLREGQLPLDEALAITRQAAGALAHAHSHDVVHRDIKPENLLLQGDQVVVADFGIARAITAAGGDRLTESGIAVGTPAYMSPEQAMGERTLDGRTDVYSLACVLYEMLAGEPPYTGPTAQAILAKRLTDPVPPLRTVRASVPAELARVIEQALARVPADRFATAIQFVEALDRGMRAAAPPRVIRWPRARWTVAAAVFGLAAVLGTRWVVHRARSTLDPNLIAVAPFDVPDRKFELYREGIVDMLSRNLDGAGSLRTVSPTVVMHRWRGRADPVSAGALGRQGGAGRVVFGQLIGEAGDSVRLKASVLDVVSGRVLAERDRTDAADRIDHLVDSITVDLLQELGGGARGRALRFSSVGTKSLPALKAFLQGQQFLRRGAFDSAAAAYQRATSLDTAFALAFRGLLSANGWLGVYQGADSLAYRAASLIRGLAPRDSLLIASDYLAWSQNDSLNHHVWSDGERRFVLLQEAVRRYPEDPEFWYQLGEAVYHSNWTEGKAAREAWEAFDRAIALDSTFAPAYLHNVTLAFQGGDTAAAGRYVRGYLGFAQGAPEGHGIGLVATLMDPAQSTSPALARLLDTASATVLFGAFDAINGWRDSAETELRLLRLLRRVRRGVGVNADTGWTNWILRSRLAGRGHLREALAMQGTKLDMRLLDLGFAGAISAEAVEAGTASWLQNPGDRSLLADPAFANACGRAFGVAWWWAGRSDTNSLAILAARSEPPPGTGATPLARLNALGTSQFARAALALARGDTAQALQRMVALPDSLCPDSWYLKMARFQLLAATGRDRAAALEFDRGAISPPGGATGVLATLARGRVAERLGDRSGALRAYQFVAEAWRFADPELRAYVAEASDGLRRLSAEPRP